MASLETFGAIPGPQHETSDPDGWALKLFTRSTGPSCNAATEPSGYFKPFQGRVQKESLEIKSPGIRSKKGVERQLLWLILNRRRSAGLRMRSLCAGSLHLGFSCLDLLIGQSFCVAFNIPCAPCHVKRPLLRTFGSNIIHSLLQSLGGQGT